MIQVEVNFFSAIKMMTKESKINLQIPEKTFISDLLNTLKSRYGEPFYDLVVDDSQQLQKHVMILLNGRGIGLLQGLQTPLHDGDSVSIIPAIGGG